MRKFNPILRDFALARHANVGVIFALTILPGIMMVGLGVDYSRTITAKSSLDAAADAAALGAATLAQSTLQSPSTNGNVGVAVYAGTYAGQQVFAANAVKVGQWIGSTPNPNVTVNVNGPVISAQVNYSTTVKTTFGGIFGVASMPIGGSSSASLTLPAYLNITVAVDVSQSMGLASTAADMTKLQGLTQNSCAFGCHVSTTGGPSNEQIAHSNNIELRVDVIRKATQNMIQTAQALQGSAGMINFALYTMQAGNPADPDVASVGGQALGTLMSSSHDYSALITAANGIDLGPNDSSGIGDTHFDTAMPLLTNAVPASGDGLTPGNPQQFAFIMTDGVQDFRGGCGYGHCTQAFDPRQCDALKAKGVTVGVIYTTYLAMPERPEYRDLVQPFADQLAPNLRACASDSWFYEASDSSDIQAAIHKLFARATSHGVLTQ